MDRRMLLHPELTGQLLEKEESVSNLWYKIHYGRLNCKLSSHKFDIDDDKRDLKGISIENQKEIEKIGSDILKQQEKAMARLNINGAYAVGVINAKINNGIVHGFGSGHVAENSITIHPVYGIPYIPGSSIKGVLRRWFIEAFLEGQEKNMTIGKQSPEKFKEAAALGRMIFGTTDQAGCIQLYDVFLVDNLKIEPDVLTPHFGSYYSKSSFPIDTLVPVPNQFYVVSVKSAKIFYSVQKNRVANDAELEKLIQMIGLWIGKALVELGIGGKTSSGYGRFNHVVDETNSTLQSIEKKLLEEIKIAEIEKQKKCEERRLSQLSPEERLIEEITKLNPKDDNDIEDSKSKIYVRIIEQKNVKAAKLLKNFWEESNNWVVASNKKKPSKQANKVSDILKLLNSEGTED